MEMSKQRKKKTKTVDGIVYVQYEGDMFWVEEK